VQVLDDQHQGAVGGDGFDEPPPGGDRNSNRVRRWPRPGGDGGCTFFALFPNSYQYDSPLWQKSPETVLSVLIIAALVTAAGVCIRIPRTRWLIGPGLLIVAVLLARDTDARR
jgi:hypothetical protein